MSDLLRRLTEARRYTREHFPSGNPGKYVGEMPADDFYDGIDCALQRLDGWERATGGLPPDLVAKALAWYQSLDRTSIVIRTNLSYEEAAALRAATFEVPT